MTGTADISVRTEHAARQARARGDRRGRLRQYLPYLPLVVVVSFFIVGSLFLKPEALHPAEAVLPPRWAGDNGSGLLGTDSLGRDVLARVIAGARTSIFVSFGGAMLGVLIGVPMAFVSAMDKGFRSWLVDRLMDLQLAVPFIILALFIASVVQPGVPLLIAMLSLPAWVYCARILRGVLLEELPKNYVLAARLMGATSIRIARRYLLPHILPTLAVVIGNLCASLVLLEATLSFLGIGLPPPAPTLGGMMLEGREYMSSAWWISFFPGIAVFMIVSSLYLALDRGHSGYTREGRGADER